MRFRPQGGIAFLPPDFPQPCLFFKIPTKQPAKSFDLAGYLKKPCSKLLTPFLHSSPNVFRTPLFLLRILKRKYDSPYRLIKTHISLIGLSFSTLQPLDISNNP